MDLLIQAQGVCCRSFSIPTASEGHLMKFEQEIYDNCVVIRPELTRLDATVAPAFRETVAAAAAEHNTLIVVDLVNVDFMDSSGLGAVIGCYKSMQDTGGLALCSVHENVKEVFTLTHMDRIFEIHNELGTYIDSKAA